MADDLKQTENMAERDLTREIGSNTHLNVPVKYRSIRKRSFDDAQSRLKSRKILGMGGKEPSKVLQMLGNCEHLETKLPPGLCIWLMVSSILFLFMAIVCLVLSKPLSHMLGVDHARVTVIEVRLLGSTFAGLAGLTWLTNVNSYLVIRNVLVAHLTYFCFATIVFTREVFVKYTPYTGLCLCFHLIIFSFTLYYTTTLWRVNRPIPDKPVSFADSDDNANL